LTTGVASANVILLAGNASARDDSIPISRHIVGYANREATAIPKFGRIIAMYYSQLYTFPVEYVSFKFGTVIEHGDCKGND
jgi:hypothetical protein